MMLLLVTCFILLLLFILLIAFADSDLTLLFHHLFSAPKDFKDEVIWIVGASSGIGEFLAYSLIKRNAKLALSGRNVERLQNVKKHCLELTKCSEDDVFLVPFSIEKFEDHDECVQKVLNHFGHIDILVNNAGLSQRANFAEIDVDMDIYLFKVNVFGLVNLTRKVLKHFMERKKGHVVITSSLAGKGGVPYSSTYTGSKHALHGYFECLRTEMIHDNINVTMICPGAVFSLLPERCLTGKIGERYDFVQKSTDVRMKTDRCSELMVTAIANKLDECWISNHPMLLILYLVQYTPSIFRNHILKRIFSKEKFMKLRQGR